jgi:transmembrane sensor
MTMSDFTPELSTALERVLALEASPADHARIAAWVGIDAERAAWLAAVRTTVDADPSTGQWDVERAWSAVKARRERVGASVSPGVPRWTRTLVVAGAAAAALLLAGQWRPSRHEPQSADRRVSWQSPVGETRRGRLPDGTDVVLASASSLTYIAQIGRREVELVGQAAFEVAPDSTRPFEVRAPFGTVTVLGTGFDVAAYRDDAVATVSVTHGRVAVRSAARGEATVLEAGDMATIRDDRVSRSRVLDSAAVGAWRDGRLVFRDVPIGRVARELTRWGRPLVVAPELDGRRVTITLRIEALAAAPQQLALALDAVLRGDTLTTGVR